MSSIGQTVTYKAPTDVQAGDPRILARVGPGTENAALVTGMSGDAVNLRVFPDQQTEFSITGITETEDPAKGSFAMVAAAGPASRSNQTAKAPSVQPLTSSKR